MARFLTTASIAVMAAAMVGGQALAQTTDGPLGEGMVIYMQMGGNPGDGATLARTTGARDAAKAYGVKLIEQYSAWAPEVMLNHFREAAAASPTCIGIMGHPGSDAFADLVDEARGQGIVITSGNAPLTALFDEHQASGFGYAGVELYAGGFLTGKSMVDAGIVAGDKALVYGLLSEAERGLSTKGLIAALEEGGAVVDYLEISPEVNSDSSLAVPILTAYLANNPDVKAMGTQHGGITSFMPKALQDAGKAPLSGSACMRFRMLHCRWHRSSPGNHRWIGGGLHQHPSSTSSSICKDFCVCRSDPMRPLPPPWTVGSAGGAKYGLTSRGTGPPRGLSINTRLRRRHRGDMQTVDRM